jgi:hypothetical protein
MRLKRKLLSVHLDIVLILMQDRCTVCIDHTIGSENHFGCTRWNPKVTLVLSNLVLVHLEIVFVLVLGRCMICTKRTIGSVIVLTRSDGTPR